MMQIPLSLAVVPCLRRVCQQPWKTHVGSKCGTQATVRFSCVCTCKVHIFRTQQVTRHQQQGWLNLPINPAPPHQKSLP
ncbi:hypothetical protein F5B22DRAFT_612264 [Xylaria bambusicola]|uniref:uncharacterized protein n=1 Tax=Xylaria bambusicola TaxID=326684 RepID=UPI00200809FC|nr:uncharacterized protein F5B22DRAFT_612264 [Xylaria bambusicola]KAI0513102.1 hypothetical protein F5B22DRAFT_612264 [Xylaria bambusicola]